MKKPSMTAGTKAHRAAVAMKKESMATLKRSIARKDESKFKSSEEQKNNSYFEMIYTTVVKIDDDVNTKEELEPIFLKEVPTEVYPKMEKAFLEILNHSGYKNVSFESKVNFDELYKNRKN